MDSAYDDFATLYSSQEEWNGKTSPPEAIILFWKRFFEWFNSQSESDLSVYKSDFAIPGFTLDRSNAEVFMKDLDGFHANDLPDGFRQIHSELAKLSLKEFEELSFAELKYQEHAYGKVETTESLFVRYKEHLKSI